MFPVLFLASACTAEIKDETADTRHFPKQQQPDSILHTNRNSVFSFQLVRLKDSAGMDTATRERKPVFALSSKELFYYDFNSGNAWMTDGRMGYLKAEHVVKADTVFTKFKFDPLPFFADAENELVSAAKAHQINLNELIRRVGKKEIQAFKEFFEWGKLLDGAAVSQYEVLFWAIINSWSDQELAGFLANKDEVSRDFCDFMLSNCPLVEAEGYFRKFYPETLASCKSGNGAGR